VSRPKGFSHSPETRLKIKEAVQRSRTPEFRAKISAALKGRKHSPEHIANNAKAHKGKKASDSTKIKMSMAHQGPKNPRWIDGRRPDQDGYIHVLCRDHPFADRHGYVLEHRLVMERHIGRTLLPTEIVHHINGDNQDNRIENLFLFSSQSEHARLHGRRMS
jgi:hypothetical protein